MQYITKTRFFLFNYNTLNRRTKNKTKGVLLSFITVRKHYYSFFWNRRKSKLFVPIRCLKQKYLHYAKW